MKELTDNEIIKALECCTGIINIESCSQCPACVGCADCVDILREESLALINRLQADKEALIAGQETLQKALAEKIAEVERSTNLCQEQNIEIKRLIETKNRLLYNLKTVCKEKDEEAVKAEAEVERLNEWVNYLNKECCELAEKYETETTLKVKQKVRRFPNYVNTRDIESDMIRNIESGWRIHTCLERCAEVIVVYEKSEVDEAENALKEGVDNA